MAGYARVATQPNYVEQMASNAAGYPMKQMGSFVESGDVQAIADRSRHTGGWYAAFLRVLITFTVVALAITFIFLSSFNVWNARIDYNTDFYGRDCLDDDDDSGACIESTLLPQKAVDGNWLMTFGYLACSMGLIVLGVLIYLINFSKLHWDAAYGDEDAYVREMGKKGPGFYNAFLDSVDFITNEELNGLTIWHNVLHSTYTPFLGVLMFARSGVRDFWELAIIFSLYVFCAAALQVAQLINRSRRRIGSNPDIVTAAVGEFGIKSWFPIIIYTVVYLFLWSIYVVYAVKYPSHSRDWSFILSAIFYTVVQAVQLVYFLGYFGAHDVRFGGKGSNASVLSVLTWALTLPFRKFGGGPFFFVLTALISVLYIPVAILFSAFYLLVRGAAALYLMVDTEGRFKSVNSWSSNTIFNILLNLLNGVLLFLPFIVLGGMAHKANIADIKWPVSFSLY